MRRIILPVSLALLAVVLVAACVPVTSVRAPAPAADAQTVTVYKSPT